MRRDNNWSAGLIAAGGGLLDSPELTVGAVVLAIMGVWPAGVALQRQRHVRTRREADA